MTPTPHESKPNTDKENEFDTEEIMNNDFFNIQEFISNAAAALIEAAQDATENDVFSETSSDEEDICLENDNEIDVNDTIFSVLTWHKDFKNVTVPTTIIKIPDEIVEWFKTGETTDYTNCPRIDDFQALVEQTIENYGGTVYIKNNWHAPTDAEMFSLNRLLKCTNYNNVIYFMSVSTKLSTDFEKNMGDHGFCLQIRSWMDIHPATEFRCIVVHKQLMGITSKDWPTYYKHFKIEASEIINQITDFFNQHIQRFPMDHYIFDVILTPGDDCKLWDFSPLNDSTQLHSFIWDEISNLIAKPAPDEETKPPAVFRFLKDEPGLCPSKNVGYSLQFEN